MNAEWMLVPVFGALALLIIDAERFFALRDRILKQVYEEDRTLWNELGKPTGRIWRPAGEKSNALHGYNRDLWRRGSKLDQFIPAKSKFECMRSIGQRIMLLDIPLVVGALVVFATISGHSQKSP